MAAPGSARQGGVGGSAQGAQGGSLPKVELPKAIPEDVKQVLTNWGGILSQLTGVTKTYLKMATRSLGPNGELMLVFDDKKLMERVRRAEPFGLPGRIKKRQRRIGLAKRLRFW